MELVDFAESASRLRSESFGPRFRRGRRPSPNDARDIGGVIKFT